MGTIFITNYMSDRANLNKSGIYRIKNKLNGKSYIGSAKNIRIRWKIHRADIRRQDHDNIYLQAAFDKYGFENFEWTVIELVDCSELIAREQHWMDHFCAHDRRYGYNLSPTAGSPLGVKHTPESRARMSAAHMGHKRSPETNAKIIQSRFRRVFQFTLDGKLVAEHPSFQAAEAATGVSYQQISGCCRGINRFAKGFQWSYTATVKPLKMGVTSKRAVVDAKTGERFPSVRRASIDRNVSIWMICKWLKEGLFVYA